MTPELQVDRAWWQTALHVGIAAVLFLPLMAIMGAALATASVMPQSSIVGLLLLSAQYAVAAFLSLHLPAMALQRSHREIAASIWCTGLVALVLVRTAQLDGSDWQWALVAAMAAGIVVGSVAYVKRTGARRQEAAQIPLTISEMDIHPAGDEVRR